MTVAWKQQQERGSPLAIRLMAWVADMLGRPIARALLYPVCLYYLCGSCEANRSLRRYYQHLQGFSVCSLHVCPVSEWVFSINPKHAHKVNPPAWEAFKPKLFFHYRIVM